MSTFLRALGLSAQAQKISYTLPKAYRKTLVVLTDKDGRVNVVAPPGLAALMTAK